MTLREENHYMGFGDVNKDGRGDIACAAPEGGWIAWWEQPEDPTVPWRKHLISDDEKGATNILPLDLNGDNHMDFLISRGHTQGLAWYKGPEYRKIEIDPELSRPHCLDAVDVDQDGDIDFASCSAAVGEPAAWFENDGKGGFTKHILDSNQSSYDIRFIDFDNDGDKDILIGGNQSHNVVWFENPLK